MAGFVNGVSNFFAGALESPQVAKVRKEFGERASYWKTVSTIVGLAAAVFSVIFILHGALIAGVVSGLSALICLDIHIAAKNACQLAKEPRHFLYLPVWDQKAREAQSKKVVLDFIDKVTEGTIFVKWIMNGSLSEDKD